MISSFQSQKDIKFRSRGSSSVFQQARPVPWHQLSLPVCEQLNEEQINNK